MNRPIPHGDENARAFDVIGRQLVLPFAGRGPAAVPKRGDHHLYHEKGKGWMLRVTICRGKKVIGKRVKFNLATQDLAQAERHRDVILRALKRLGLTVVTRMHKKTKPTS